MPRLPQALIRFLLAVFLATILNPSFGYDVVVGESDHDHVLVVGAYDHEGNKVDDDDDHGQHAPHHAGHDRIGHLLSHLPADLPTVPALAVAQTDHVMQAILPLLTLQELVEGFFRPPRISSSV